MQETKETLQKSGIELKRPQGGAWCQMDTEFEDFKVSLLMSKAAE